MADEYIKRKDVLECIKESRDGIDWGQSEDGDAFLHYSACLYRTIASNECFPSADVAEVRHGEWIKKPHWEPLPWDCDPSLSSTPDDYDEKTHSEKVMWWHCSCCDYSPDRGWKPHLNFCPNCGARMDKEQTNG